MALTLSISLSLYLDIVYLNYDVFSISFSLFEPYGCEIWFILCFCMHVSLLFPLAVFLYSECGLWSIHHIYVFVNELISSMYAEKETVLELINVERIRSLHSDANSSDRIGNQSSRLLSEEITLRANTMHFIRNPRLDNHKNMTISSYMSSDQPLPPDHLCHGFTLPPPPSDKKRTGPRRECLITFESTEAHM